MRPTSSRLALAAALVAAGGAGAGAVALGDESSDRQEDVARRGASVMPFDLDATTHRFVKRPYGGLQIVVADRPGDRREIRLIRDHLREEASAFGRGDFEDPAAIHGAEMPGLDTLRGSAGRLEIEVGERADGAQLRFRTRDRAVRDALHAWFDAQVTDHGDHAER